MIHTSKQLKDKVRNISHGDNEIAQMMIRCFIMERFWKGYHYLSIRIISY